MTGKAEVRKRRPGSVDRRDAGDATAFALDLLLIFEQFVEALLQEKEELESKEDEAEEEEEEETLFAHIPEHSPTEIEYWKMQQVFKIPPS
jgi:hypothetical protein